MRLFCRKFLGDADSTFVVDDATSTITLNVPDEKSHADESRTIAYKLEIPETGYWVYYFDLTGKVVRLNGLDVMMSINSPAYLTKFYIAHPSKSLIAVSFDDIVILRAKVSGDGIDTFDTETYQTNLDFLATLSPEAAAISKKFAARQESIFSIDTQASLSSLEKQVDYLTKLLATLIPGDEILTNYIERTSLFNSDAIPKSLDFKMQLRELQHVYDAKK